MNLSQCVGEKFLEQMSGYEGQTQAVLFFICDIFRSVNLQRQQTKAVSLFFGPIILTLEKNILIMSLMLLHEKLFCSCSGVISHVGSYFPLLSSHTSELIAFMIAHCVQ